MALAAAPGVAAGAGAASRRPDDPYPAGGGPRKGPGWCRRLASASSFVTRSEASDTIMPRSRRNRGVRIGVVGDTQAEARERSMRRSPDGGRLTSDPLASDPAAPGTAGANPATVAACQGRPGVGVRWRWTAQAGRQAAPGRLLPRGRTRTGLEVETTTRSTGRHAGARRGPHPTTGPYRETTGALWPLRANAPTAEGDPNGRGVCPVFCAAQRAAHTEERSAAVRCYIPNGVGLSRSWGTAPTGPLDQPADQRR